MNTTPTDDMVQSFRDLGRKEGAEAMLEACVLKMDVLHLRAKLCLDLNLSVHERLRANLVVERLKEAAKALRALDIDEVLK